MSETDLQRDVLLCLQAHPMVAWAQRQNTGGAYLGDPPQYVKFGVEGDADITGQLRGGRRLEVEVKVPGEWPSEATFERWLRGEGYQRRPFKLTDDKRRLIAQRAKIQLVNEHGGLAFIAYGPEEVYAELGDPVEALRASPRGDRGRAFRQAMLQAHLGRRGSGRRGGHRWMEEPKPK